MTTLNMDAFSADSVFIRINVSGTTYVLLRTNLRRQPNSRLGQLVNSQPQEAAGQCDHYDVDRNEYYFARSPIIFEHIVHFYNTGKLYWPSPFHICAAQFTDELAFWQIDAPASAGEVKKAVGSNVTRKISSSRNCWETKSLLNEHARSTVSRQNSTTLREKVWLMLEEPFGTISGKIFAVWSLTVLLLSTVLVVLSSYPRFQPIKYVHQSLSVNASDLEIQVYQENLGHYRRHLIFLILHNFCHAWFTIELILRVYAAPHRLIFLRTPLAVIDVLSVIPYYIFLAIAHSHLIPSFDLVCRMLFGFRMLRVLLLFRLVQFSESFKLIFTTLFSNKSELGSLLALYLVLIPVLSTVAYFIESTDPKSPIQNIPKAMYWCFITITTVGYGDVVPVTLLGQVFTCAMTVVSIVTLAMPLAIIVSKFMKVYEEHEIALDKNPCDVPVA